MVTPKEGQCKEYLIRTLYPQWVQSSQKSSVYSFKTRSTMMTDGAKATRAASTKGRDA